MLKNNNLYWGDIYSTLNSGLEDQLHTSRQRSFMASRSLHSQENRRERADAIMIVNF